MEDNEIIAKLCEETVEHTPDIYGKILKAAKAEGLIKTNAASTSATSSVGSGSSYAAKTAVKAAARSPKKGILIAVASTLAALVAATAVVVPLTLKSRNGGLGGNGGEISAPDDGNGGSENESTGGNNNGSDNESTGGGNNGSDNENTGGTQTPSTPENPENYTKGLRYELSEDGKSYKMTGLPHSVCEEAIIPSYHEGKPVTAIGTDSYFESLSIIGVSNIGSLKKLVVPDTVTKIEDYAFCEADKLEDIQLGKGITEIGKSAFSHTRFYYNKDNWDNGALYIGEYLISAKHTWYHGETGETLQVPEVYAVKEGTRVIADEAFHFNHESLKKVTFPESLVAIGKDVFSFNENLTQIILPDNLKRVGERAFLNCKNLATLKLGGSIEYIGKNAFTSCEKISEIRLPESLTYIGDEAFSNLLYVTEITVPDKVTYIGNKAFNSCQSLVSVKLGTSVEYIGCNAFQTYITTFKSITVPASVKFIGKKAFSEMEELVFENASSWRRTANIFEQDRENIGGMNQSINVILGDCWDITSKYGVDLYALLQDRYAELVVGENGGLELGELKTLDIYFANIPEDKNMCAAYYIQNDDCFWYKY